MVIASLSLALALSTPAFQSADELPYAELAQRFLEAHGQTGQVAEDVDVGSILERDFFSTRVGQFEVWIPIVNLSEKETANDYQGVCASLCEAQSKWIEWLSDSAEHGADRVKEFDTLRKWIDKWKTSKLMSLKPGDQKDPTNALDLFGATDELRQLSDHLAQIMQSGSIMGTSIEITSPSRLVLMPNRKEFVEFLAFAGWVLPDAQSSFWIPGIENWTEFRLNDLQVIALQYPASVPVKGKYDGATSMKDRDVSGLEQQVVQMGLNRLLAYQHGDALPNSVISGISIEMLIEMYGACHTRNDGDMRSRQASAREVFVAGGASEGGMLPQNIASSRWRSDNGKYHYTKILKQVQKSGASSDKRNRHKYNSFLLVGDNESDRHIAHAPVFGEHAKPETPPPGVQGDYAEFLRAYNVAFLHWLRTDASGSAKKSEASFAQLLAMLSSSDTEVTMSKALEETYGMPLSNAEVDLNCLEGVFLKWISKQ